jgi:hypothetical protein
VADSFLRTQPTLANDRHWETCICSKYKQAELAITQKRAALKQKIPELQKTIEVIIALDEVSGQCRLIAWIGLG